VIAFPVGLLLAPVRNRTCRRCNVDGKVEEKFDGAHFYFPSVLESVDCFNYVRQIAPWVVHREHFPIAMERLVRGNDEVVANTGSKVLVVVSFGAYGDGLVCTCSVHHYKFCGTELGATQRCWLRFRGCGLLIECLEERMEDLLSIIVITGIELIIRCYGLGMRVVRNFGMCMCVPRQDIGTSGRVRGARAALHLYSEAINHTPLAQRLYTSLWLSAFLSGISLDQLGCSARAPHTSDSATRALTGALVSRRRRPR